MAASVNPAGHEPALTVVGHRREASINNFTYCWGFDHVFHMRSRLFGTCIFYQTTFTEMEIRYDLRHKRRCSPMTTWVKIILDTLNTEEFNLEKHETHRNMQDSCTEKYFKK